MSKIDYESFSEHLQPGRLVFMADNGLVSRFIRKQSGSFPYSHVCIVGENQTLWTTSAEVKWSLKPPFVRFLYGNTPAKAYLKDKTNLCILEYKALTQDQWKGIEAMCKAMTGTEYPLAKLIKMIAKGQAAKGVTCTESCTTAYKDRAKNEICTEGVVAAFYWGAHIELNPKAANLNPSGYDLVEVFYSPRLDTVWMKGEA